MILTFSNISKVTKNIEADPDVKFEKLIPIICEQFGFDNCKIIYGGKIINPENTVDSISYKPGSMIIVTPAGKKSTNPAPSSPATPAPAAAEPATEPATTPATTESTTAPAAPVLVSTTKRYQRKKLIPSPTISTALEIKYESAEKKSQEANPMDTLSDEEFIKNKIESLPNKEKFDENVADLLNINPDRILVIRALLASDNNILFASNMLCFEPNRIPPLRPPVSQPRPQIRDVNSIIDFESKNQIISMILPQHLGLESELYAPLPAIDRIEAQIFKNYMTKRLTYIKKIFTPQFNVMEYNNTLARLNDMRFNDPSRAFAVLGIIFRRGVLLHISQIPYISTQSFTGNNELENLSPEDRQAVMNISQQTGVPIQVALQYYDACDHDANLAIEQIRFSMG